MRVSSYRDANGSALGSAVVLRARAECRSLSQQVRSECVSSAGRPARRPIRLEERALTFPAIRVRRGHLRWLRRRRTPRRYRSERAALRRWGARPLRRVGGPLRGEKRRPPSVRTLAVTGWAQRGSRTKAPILV